VTKVIGELRRKWGSRGFTSALVLGSLLFFAQSTRSRSQSSGAEATPGAERAAESLYLQLRSVALDNSRVYKVRDVAFDRAAFHITLDDGTIAFTEDVAGHVTGAFFEGEGEVLLSPPNQVERASMALFTGAAILEEKFLTAYFRFNDSTFAELQPSLRPTDEGEQFASQWNQTARNLAEVDALRLLVTFSRDLPTAEPFTAAKNQDQVLHARVFGRKLGAFDIYYDSTAKEQIWAGQLKRVAITTSGPPSPSINGCPQSGVQVTTALGPPQLTRSIFRTTEYKQKSAPRQKCEWMHCYSLKSKQEGSAHYFLSYRGT